MIRRYGKVVFLTGGGGALGRASAELFAQEGAKISIIDAMLALYAICDFDAEAPLAQQEPDYFHIQYQVNTDAVVVASTGLNPGSGWEILHSGQMLVNERDTLKI